MISVNKIKWLVSEKEGMIYSAFEHSSIEGLYSIKSNLITVKSSGFIHLDEGLSVYDNYEDAKKEINRLITKNIGIYVSYERFLLYLKRFETHNLKYIREDKINDLINNEC